MRGLPVYGRGSSWLLDYLVTSDPPPNTQKKMVREYRSGWLAWLVGCFSGA